MGALMSDTAKPEELPLRQRVQQVIDMIRPAIQSDGGDVELVDVDDQGVVQLRMHGACIGCPSATMTLKMGIERNLRARVPEVREVVCVG
jgi:Fe-S cluster biogenesis protein NfuA